MYFTLKAIARTLVLPPAGPLLLALLGMWLWRWGGERARHWARRCGLGLTTAALLALWLLCTPVCAEYITRLVEHYPALDVDKPIKADAIVVIGGGTSRVNAPEYRGPAADLVLLDRLAYAAFLAQHTGLPIAISGAPEETLAMADTLERNFNLRPRWIEGHSRDTFENARFSAKLLEPQGIHQVVLVTSTTHLWRATHEFQDAGFEVLPAPAGMRGNYKVDALSLLPSPFGLLRSNAAIYELLGEPMRRVQEALGIREKLDRKADLAPS